MLLEAPDVRVGWHVPSRNFPRSQLLIPACQARKSPASSVNMMSIVKTK